MKLLGKINTKWRFGTLFVTLSICACGGLVDRQPDSVSRDKEDPRLISTGSSSSAGIAESTALSTREAGMLVVDHTAKYYGDLPSPPPPVNLFFSTSSSSSVLFPSSSRPSTSSPSERLSLFKLFPELTRRIGSFLPYADIFNGLVPTRRGVESYFNSELTWSKLAKEEGISLESCKDPYNKMYASLLLRKLLLGKLPRISIINYRSWNKRMRGYVGGIVFDKLYSFVDPEPLFVDDILEAASSPSNEDCEDARDLVSWAHLNVPNMAEYEPEAICEFLMGSPDYPPHISLLTQAIVHPYFTEHQRLNMACCIGMLTDSKRPIRVLECERAGAGYLYAARHAKSKKDAYIKKAVELVAMILARAEHSITAQQYELSCKIYDNLGNSLPAGADKVASCKRAAELADRMLRAAGDSATAGQYEQASNSYYNLGFSLLVIEERLTALKKAAGLSEQMLKAAGRKATASQYEGASKIYYSLGFYLPSGPEKVAACGREYELENLMYSYESAAASSFDMILAHRSSDSKKIISLRRDKTELAEQMLREVGDTATAGQYEQACRSYFNLRSIFPDRADREAVLRRTIELADRMLRVAGETGTAEQLSLACRIYHELGWSLPAGSDKVAALRMSAELAGRGLRLAGGRATRAQYEGASISYANLGDSLPSGADKEAARKRAAELEAMSKRAS
jgi:hypothetical protein